MRTSTSIALWTARITGLLQLILGALFWTGNAQSLIPVHMLSGSILVLALWVLAAQVIMTGANPGLGWFAIFWGVVTVALGMTQMQILPGSLHWVVQVAHLLVGIGAMGLADSAAKRVAGEQVYAR